MEIEPTGTIMTTQTSYMWQIEELNSLWNCKPGEAIKSPIFTTQKSNSQQKLWNMFLFFSGDCDKNKQYLSIFVQPQCNTCEEKQFRLSILNKQMKKVYGVLFSERLSYCKDRVRWGSSKFIHKHVLSELANELMPNNLTILCEVIVNYIGTYSVMHYQEKKMHSDVGSLLESGTFSDLCIVVDGKQFTTHKNILAARSPTFAKWFEDNTIKQNQSTIKIDNVTCKTFRKILQFIYTETTDFQADSALELLVAATLYQLDDLKSLCEEVLSENLNLGNVANIHVLADTNHAVNLKEHSMNFIIENAREILDTPGYKDMVKNYPHLLQEIYEQTVSRH